MVLPNFSRNGIRLSHCRGLSEYVGERLDPATWGQERKYFSREPYRGVEGKLRKVMELVGLDWSPGNRPLQTVLELKRLRDLITHGKPEKLTGTVVHRYDTNAATPESALRQMVVLKEKLIVIKDVEEFIQSIHTLAAPKVTDNWFGGKALHGTSQYTAYGTT